jgi:hypothetical protein
MKYFLNILLNVQLPPATKSNNKFKLKMNTRNYIKKIQAQTCMSELLRVKLVEAHEHISSKSPYLLHMLDPKLDVKKSWHSTVTAALGRAKLLGGEYNIYINHFETKTLLTQEQIEIVRSCEEGELDPENGCSIAVAKAARAAREAENYEIDDDEYAALNEQLDEICSNALAKAECAAKEEDDDTELLEMWLEKMDRPGRRAARGTEEPAIDILLREKAMEEIYKMSAKEFQTRLLEGTLPDFPRAAPPTGIIRDTCHEMRLLTDEDFEKPNRAANYAEANKGKLRYMSAECFKQNCYEEFQNYSFLD